MKTYAQALYTAALLTACSPAADSNHPSGQNAQANTESDGKNITLLNASYDVTRYFYKNTTTYLSKHTNPNTPAHPSASNNPTAASANRHYP